jgi:hypothetical protein
MLHQNFDAGETHGWVERVSYSFMVLRDLQLRQPHANNLNAFIDAL